MRTTMQVYVPLFEISIMNMMKMSGLKLADFIGGQETSLRLMPPTSGVNPKKTEHNFQKSMYQSSHFRL